MFKFFLLYIIYRPSARVMTFPTSIPGPFLELGREKALASAGHMTPRISGCKNMLISVVSVSVCINNKSEK